MSKKWCQGHQKVIKCKKSKLWAFQSWTLTKRNFVNILLIRGDILILVCLYYFTIDFSKNMKILVLIGCESCQKSCSTTPNWETWLSESLGGWGGCGTYMNTHSFLSVIASIWNFYEQPLDRRKVMDDINRQALDIHFRLDSLGIQYIKQRG